MTDAQKILLEMSRVRSRLNEIAGLEGDDFTDEVRTEAKGLQAEYGDLEVRHRAAIIGEDEGETTAAPPDAEGRERIELRSRASLARYLAAFTKGRAPDGAEAELSAAAEAGEDIPLEMWDTAAPEAGEVETRAVTGAPSTVGVNFDRIFPALFAASIAPRLGIAMPRVKSGTFATATISTSTTAAAKSKGEDAPATAAAFTVATATPKRVSAMLELAAEDLAAVGIGNFEASLRENLALALSDELDKQVLSGDGSAPNLTGLFKRLTDPEAPEAGVVDFDGFVSTFAGGIDGLWASRMADVGIVCGVDTYALSARTFRDATGQDLGAVSFADYAAGKYGGWWTNKRMPATASNVQAGILYRRGRSGVRTATCPHWGRITIDDMYTGAAKAQRRFVFHVLLGDVLIVQPDAYAQVAFRVST